LLISPRRTDAEKDLEKAAEGWAGRGSRQYEVPRRKIEDRYSRLCHAGQRPAGCAFAGLWKASSESGSRRKL